MSISNAIAMADLSQITNLPPTINRKTLPNKRIQQINLLKTPPLPTAPNDLIKEAAESQKLKETRWPRSAEAAGNWNKKIEKGWIFFSQVSSFSSTFDAKPFSTEPSLEFQAKYPSTEHTRVKKDWIFLFLVGGR